MWTRLACATALALATLACASAIAPLEPVTVSTDDLLTGEALGLQAEPAGLVSADEVLQTSPAMRRFSADFIDRDAGSFLKLQQLLHAIINEGSFGLEYDDRTRTAAQTFADRKGNCLSFSNMFIAMARELGLSAHYQEVEIPPDWTFDNDTYLLNRHVNVLVDLGVSGEHVVDFNIDDFRSSYDRRRISDSRALAHYFNNLGVERLQAGDSAAAMAYFRRAIADSDRRFSPAWTNLGTLYLRGGRPRYAEAAYLQALDVDHDDSVAMSSLANLYERLGDAERAGAYRARVENHRKQNPYYRFHLAREAFFERDFETAVDHLKYAVRKKPNEDQFYFLLGLVHLQRGDEAEARRWLQRAEEAAATDSLKRNYATKLDLLLRSSE